MLWNLDKIGWVLIGKIIVINWLIVVEIVNEIKFRKFIVL